MAETSYLDAIRQGLWEEMEADGNVFVLGEDIGAYGGAFKVTRGMLETMSHRSVAITVITTP